MTLLDECLEALGEYSILNDQKAENIISVLHFNRLGHIKREEYISFREISEKDIEIFLNESCYIVYSDVTVPKIKTTIENVLKNLDDVLAVSFDTWLIVETKRVIIEFYHEGDITLLNFWIVLYFTCFEKRTVTVHYTNLFYVII